jgi:hypothetical protein
LDEATLKERLYRRAVPLTQGVPTPDFPAMHRELARRGVTRRLLWQEFKAQYISRAGADLLSRYSPALN